MRALSATTRERSQALHYAMGCGWAGKDDATTLFEIQMGMIDRGAELDWLSQYPHEREVLIPPLTGLEAMSSSVEGPLLAMQSRLSLNLSAQTLEQVRPAAPLVPLFGQRVHCVLRSVRLPHFLACLRSSRCSHAAER